MIFIKYNQPFFTPTLTKKVAQLTLGIYLIHPIYFLVLHRLGISEQTIHPAVSIPVSAIIVFILSLITAWAISKIPYVRRII